MILGERGFLDSSELVVYLNTRKYTTSSVKQSEYIPKSRNYHALPKTLSEKHHNSPAARTAHALRAVLAEGVVRARAPDDAAEVRGVLPRHALFRRALAPARGVRAGRAALAASVRLGLHLTRSGVVAGYSLPL